MKTIRTNRTETLAISRKITDRIQAYLEDPEGGLQKDFQAYLGERLPQVPNRTQVQAWILGRNEPSMGTGILFQAYLNEIVIPWEKSQARKAKAQALKAAKGKDSQ